MNMYTRSRNRVNLVRKLEGREGGMVERWKGGGRAKGGGTKKGWKIKRRRIRERGARLGAKAR
jgi:hypothetical protein